MPPRKKTPKSKELSAFISYTHADRESVVPLASYLSRLGLQIWMDTDKLLGGQAIIEQVSQAIAKADLYVVFLSPKSLDSQWVHHELNTALTLETTAGKPKVLPVLLVDAQLPVSLTSRLYVDARRPLDEAKKQLRHTVQSFLGEENISAEEKREPTVPQLLISSVRFDLSRETTKSFGGFEDTFDKKEVHQEARSHLESLRRRANGILLNFVPASELDFSTPFVRFPNGNLTDTVDDTSGDIVGTFKKVARVEVEVLNPDERKLAELISSRLEALGVEKISYSFVLSPPIKGLSQRSLTRLQKEYVILAWDSDRGAEVELPDQLQITVRCSDERVDVALKTKYRFEFEKKAKAFSVRTFVDWLIRE